MSEKDSYCHGFRFDRIPRFAIDSVINHVMRPEFSPTPHPQPGFFLELNGGHMLLLNGQDWTLL